MIRVSLLEYQRRARTIKEDDLRVVRWQLLKIQALDDVAFVS